MRRLERRYYRQYDNYDKIVPRVEDFPILPMNDGEKESKIVKEESKNQSNLQNLSLKLDDIILLVLFVMMLTDDEAHDDFAILVLAFLFLSEYIF